MALSRPKKQAPRLFRNQSPQQTKTHNQILQDKSLPQTLARSGRDIAPVAGGGLQVAPETPAATAALPRSTPLPFPNMDVAFVNGKFPGNDKDQSAHLGIIK